MRLFAEEKRSGTIELLLTSPVHDHEIILGKWLGAMLLYCLLLLLSGLSFGFLFAHGQPDWKPMLAGYLGLLLQSGALLALGTFVSTLTRNQIIAGAATFGLFLLLWVFAWAGAEEQTAAATVFRYLSVFSHTEPFAKGLIDTKDVVYFLTMIFFGIFLSVRSIESLRWRA
jgi:ABC-2 type transport system permease protein